MPKTVKVRVPVVVSPDGQWVCADDLWDLPGLLMAGQRIYYLTAELPIPDSDEVAAEVEEG